LQAHSHIPIEPHACIASFFQGSPDVVTRSRAREVMAKYMQMRPKDIRVARHSNLGFRSISIGHNLIGSNAMQLRLLTRSALRRGQQGPCGQEGLRPVQEPLR
jgi:hypothetical protein